jgi:hypothetical protein
MTGIVTAPRPKPRTTSQIASAHSLGCGPASANGMVAPVTTTKPSTAMIRGPTLSSSPPATVRDSTLPTPCGTSRIPAVSAVTPRTSW